MTIAGKLMLQRHISLCEHGRDRNTLEEIFRGPRGRPELPAAPDFSISHSSGIVALAIADQESGLHVGIDIEKVIDRWDIGTEMILTPEEHKRLQLTSNPALEFYRAWTFKEATAKADGRGLSIELKSIDSLASVVVVRGLSWHLTPLDVEPGFASHLATSGPSRVDIERVGSDDVIEPDS